MKKITYGITNYKDLILEDYYYVDKTMYLEKLEDVSKVLVYLRPRRFGKTLFTSMLHYYYDVNSKDLYDDLFKSTYIYNHPTKNKNNYYILKFDFSGMSNYDGSLEDLIHKFNMILCVSINNFLDYYDLKYEIKDDLSPAEVLMCFLSFFKSLKLEKKLYIIIDEYDNFTNSILSSNNMEMFQYILGKNGFVMVCYKLKE